tara:strand:- start:992 stop:1963 length:972 start_codon:yes stop_codon:yes gene_type:complete
MNTAQKLLKSIGVMGVRQGDGDENDEVIDVEVEVEQEAEAESSDDDGEVEEEAEVEGKTEKPVESKDEETVDDDDDSVIVTIGDEEVTPDKEEEQAPGWVRELRKSHRETVRENRELKEKLKAQETPAVKPVELGKKPTLEDYEYDTDKYEQELTAWHGRKQQAEKQAADTKADDEVQKQAWQQQLATYGEHRTKLKVKDFDDAEAVTLELLNQTQQGIIVQGADNSALVIYALGKNEKKVKELASIKDPVKFAFAIAKLEKDLKVTKRKAPPAPEKKVTGTAPSSGSVDSTLERLRSDAEKTGNYSKVMDYKRQQKNKKAKK